MTIRRARELAAELVALAVQSKQSLAVAESLTGGLLASSLVEVPGTSEVFRGGVVCYQTQVKRSVLGVDAELLAEAGPVDARVAQQMAERVRDLFAVDGEPANIGLATTGVAGPAPQAGRPVGEVFVAVSSADGTRVEHFLFSGGRDEIREQAVAAVLELAREILLEREVDGE